MSGARIAFGSENLCISDRPEPVDFGPYTTCYNRVVRWRQAGVCGRIMDALATAHDASVRMIDTSIVPVHQHGACIMAPAATGAYCGTRLTGRTLMANDWSIFLVSESSPCGAP